MSVIRPVSMSYTSMWFGLTWFEPLSPNEKYNLSFIQSIASPPVILLLNLTYTKAWLCITWSGDICHYCFRICSIQVSLIDNTISIMVPEHSV